MDHNQQEKNICISEMLGWKHNTEFGYHTTERFMGNNWYDADQMKFHSNANWQYEAIEAVEKLGYIVTQYKNTCEIESDDRQYSESNNCMLNQSYYNVGQGKNRVEATFDALYQFSVYLKQKL